MELIQCERKVSETLTVSEAKEVVSQAMDQSQRVTAGRYLNLLKWLLVGIAAVAAYYPLSTLLSAAVFCLISSGESRYSTFALTFTFRFLKLL